MIRKAFPLLLVVAGVIGLLGLSLSSVFAQQAGPSRELLTGPVAQGEKFTVTITDTGYGADRAIGQVVETLPAGFSYVDGSATKVVGHATKGVVRGTVDATDSRIVTFSVVSVESFTYEVMVGDSVGDGDHTFSGAGGDDTITVEAGDDTTTEPTATPEPTAGLRGPAGPRGPGYRTCRAQGRYRGYRFQRLGDREFDPLFGSCPGRRRGSLANETAARLSNPDGLSENWGHPAQCRVPPSYWKF